MRSFLGAACFVLLMDGSAQAANWNANEISYWYSDSFREPGVSKNGAAQDIPKNILTVTHVDNYEFVHNFVNIDVLRSMGGDPAEFGGHGATEVYVVDRQDFSLGQILDTKTFATFPLRDVALEAGIDVNTKDTSFASFKRMPVAGLSAFFDVPGFWKVAILWDKEWNYNGITNTHVEFNSTLRVETAWEIPFSLSSAKFSFEGFADYNGPKGINGFGDKMRNEVLIHSQVMLDAGSFFDHPKLLKVGAGYEYWLNKFGTDHTTTQGALQSAPFARVSTVFSF